ncbi:MAG TPA: PspC domain-containing protein [Candidatus Hydrogenedentes bacterium]|nr:PspC domain-containing protein [Candidatus Hydrogenedentota bacterium]HOS02503.1 PspC domain-containing protein [Candidatus Hydrogenedentota bacterium]
MTRQSPREGRPLYRSRNGIIFGVCRGIAEHLNFSVFWTRVIAVLGLCWTGGLAGTVYILAALLMKLEPVLPIDNDGDREFYHSYLSSRNLALQRLKKTFDSLDRRLQRMEDIVTARAYDWDRRLNEEK